MSPLSIFKGIFTAVIVSLILLMVALSVASQTSVGIWLISSLLAICAGLFYDLHHLNKDK